LVPAGPDPGLHPDHLLLGLHVLLQEAMKSTLVGLTLALLPGLQTDAVS
jgi:hypothetical protein